MRKAVSVILAFFAIVGLVTIISTISQVDRTRAELVENLRYRSSLLTEGLREAVEPNFIDQSDAYLQTLVEKYSDRQRIAGLAAIDNTGTIVAASSSLPKGLPESQKVALHAMDGDKPTGTFVHDDRYYAYAVPLHNDKGVVGALMVVQHAAYVSEEVQAIWVQNFISLFIQVCLSLVVTLLVLRWFVYAPVRKLAAALKVSRLANDEDMPFKDRHPLLRPLLREVAQVHQNLVEARRSTRESTPPPPPAQRKK